MAWVLSIVLIMIIASVCGLYALLNGAADIVFKPNEPKKDNKKTA